MAQTGFTPIITYHSTTGSAVPDAANLAPGEMALNIADMKLYAENSSGVVTLLASSSGASGDVVGPASATDNAVARFDGTTGKLIQNSVVTIADSTGDISGVGTLNATTADLTNLEVTNIKAKDGTAAGSIADSTGVVTLASSVLTTTDINGGTIDGTAIGGASAAAGAFTTLNTSGAVVFNDAGADVDFRVEGDTEANLLFVDASANAVLVGTGTAGTSYAGAIALTPRVQFSASSASASLSINRDGGQPFIFLNRSSTVVSGSQTGTIYFSGSDGTNIRNTAAITSEVDGTPGTGDMPGRLLFFTTAAGSATPSERMRIDSSGNFTIGGQSATRLEVNLTENDKVELNAVDSTNIARNLVFSTGDTERARIDSSGNVLVGGTAARGTTVGTAHLDLFNGTAPAGTLTNGISLYSSSGDFNFMDAAGNGYKVGFRNVPPVGTKTGSYTLAVGDVGKYVQVGSGGSITIPDATFAEGDVVSIFNNTSGDITVTCTITTAYIAGTDSDVASVTLATRGLATILFISGTVCVISGNVS
jgi:hypothetical protein